MTNAALSAGACAVQVAVIAASALLILRYAGRKYPDAGSQAALSASIAVLAVTLLTPISLPNWLPAVLTIDAAPTVGVNPISSRETDAKRESAHHPSAEFALHPTQLLASLDQTSAGTAQPHVMSAEAALKGLLVIAGLLTTWGLTGYARALSYVKRLRHSCETIDDPTANDRLRQLTRALGLARIRITLCQSRLVTTATVIGWWNVRVILPRDWPTWTQRELTAALAHELAHVARRDYPRRMLSGLVRAVHYYNPLVHWLIRHAVRCQEINADRLAVTALGDRDNYLRALSQLALRADNSARLRVGSIVLPALSTDLIRRIKVLQTTNGRSRAASPQGVCYLLSATIVVVAIASTALRATADQNEVSAKSPEYVPSDATASQSSDEVFGRNPLDISLVGDNDSGVFAVRIGELADRREVRPLIAAANTLLPQFLCGEFGWRANAKIRLESIEEIAGDLRMSLGPYENPNEPEHTRVINFAATVMVVRLRDEVDWRKWVAENLTGVEEKSAAGVTYVEYNNDAISPFPLFIAARDSHTLVLTFSKDRLMTLIDVTADHKADAALERAWRAADGGVMTFVATDKHIEPIAPRADAEWEVAGCDIAGMSRGMSLGVDVDDTNGAISIRWQCGCDDATAASAVEQAVEQLCQFALDELSNNDDSVPVGILKCTRQLLTSRSIRTTNNDDGTCLVEVTCTADPPLQQLMIALGQGRDESQTK